MNPARLGLSVSALAVVIASAAGAQNVILTQPFAPGGGSVTAFGYYMSPYTGTLDGVTERFNCVDFFHDVTIGEHWTVISTNLGDATRDAALLGATRDGGAGGYSSLSEVLKLYQEAAWLTDQYAANPAANPNQSVAIQTAIWSIVDNGPTNPESLKYESTDDYWSGGAQVATILDTGDGSTGYWIDRAQTEYALQSDTYYDKFNILTGTGNPGAGAQEFLYSSPEPGTLVLIATGLLGIAGVVRARRRAEPTPVDA